MTELSVYVDFLGVWRMSESQIVRAEHAPYTKRTDNLR